MSQENGKIFFGYKSQINVDVKHKLIHRYTVVTAALHDTNIFKELLDSTNTHHDEERVKGVQEKGYREYI